MVFDPEFSEPVLLDWRLLESWAFFLTSKDTFFFLSLEEEEGISFLAEVLALLDGSLLFLWALSLIPKKSLMSSREGIIFLAGAGFLALRTFELLESLRAFFCSDFPLLVLEEAALFFTRAEESFAVLLIAF